MRGESQYVSRETLRVGEESFHFVHVWCILNGSMNQVGLESEGR